MPSISEWQLIELGTFWKCFDTFIVAANQKESKVEKDIHNIFLKRHKLLGWVKIKLGTREKYQLENGLKTMHEYEIPWTMSYTHTHMPFLCFFFYQSHTM